VPGAGGAGLSEPGGGSDAGATRTTAYSKVGWSASDTRELAYAKHREAFGHRIGEHQAIRFSIADMEVRTHTARLAYYHAAAKMLRGEPFKKEAAIAKLVSSEAAMDNARAATQVFGGYGFMNESPVGRFYRDAKVLEIGEGTSEVQRMLIARLLGA
jgi:short-chain 2-methylacyl-CoA dehydrogenase